MKENDGKLFEVHLKKGQGGAAPLMRSISTADKAYPLMMEQVFRRQLTQQAQEGGNNAHQGGGATYQDELLARCFKGISTTHLNLRSFPLFQIKYTPRARCKVHDAF